MKGPLLNTITRFLSDARVTRAIVALTIGGRIIQLIFFYSIRFDGSYQVIATQNLLNGHGISISKVFAADLSATVYEPLVSWPPGYSVLLAPFYALFNHNYIAAGLALDIIAATTLIFMGRRILKLFDTPLHLINIFTLLTGFFIYYFYFIASSDAITISLFMVAFYYTLSLLKTEQHYRGKTTAIILSLFACASTKYLFLPVVFIIPVFLFAKGMIDKNKILKTAGIISFTVLAVLVGLLLAWQHYISGTPAYIAEQGRGFFPAHLLAAYPYIPASFISLDSAGLLLRQSSGTGTSLYRLFQVIHLLLLILGLFLTFKWLFRHGLRKISLASSFFIMVIAIALTINILLALLSLTVAKEEILPGWLWTYVEEPRYYGLVNVLLHLSVFVFYQFYQNRRPLIAKYIFFFLLAAMLPEMFRGMLFDAKRIANFKKEEYYWQHEYRFQQYADAVIEKEKLKRPVQQIVVTGSSHYMNNRVSLYSDIPVFNENEKINELSGLSAKAPALLLVIIHEKDFPNFKPFLSSQEPVGNFEGYAFYTIYVGPR